ncbi:MAG TPA: hypothetical protein EYH56_02215, partial [Nanoarchaeota archaeon]|nr:hypothetical protein [Nanoarchaeota archaeon]
MKKRYGKWAFYKDRWVPIFAGGSTDDGNTRDREKRELNHDDGNSDLTRIQQEYERTLKFLQEKFGVSSIEELNLKLKKEEEEKLKRQEKFKELAEKKEKEALEYRQKWQQTILRAEVVGKASQMGFIDPDIVLS